MKVLVEVAIAADQVLRSFEAVMDAGDLRPGQHSALLRLDKALNDFYSGQPGAVVADARGSAGARPPGPSDHGAGQRAVVQAADSRREARP
jgi:hypothetical protein